MNDETLNIPNFEGGSCALPLRHDDAIVMGHGSGGRMTHELVATVFAPLMSAGLAQGNDSARLEDLGGRIAVSTDAHIVSPLFFAGGDIGRLAVCGTVNDVAMSGAVPLYLTAGFILEEGLPMDTLRRVVASMAQAAVEANVSIVAGDTKVAERGKVDGIYITTAGVGRLADDVSIGGERARPGDVILLSGTIGDHGIAVLSARGDLGFETGVESDVAPLNGMIADVLRAAPGVRVLRDPTRGGLGTTLNEIAQQSGVSMLLEEERIAVLPAVQAACEMLGFDPLYVANEGKLIVIVPPQEAEAALAALRAHRYGAQAARIGVVQAGEAGRVLLRTGYGTTRVIDVPAGELLPRIC